MTRHPFPTRCASSLLRLLLITLTLWPAQVLLGASAEQRFRAAEELQLAERQREAAEVYRQVVEHHRSELAWSLPALRNLIACLQAEDDPQARELLDSVLARYVDEATARMLQEDPAGRPAEPELLNQLREALLWRDWEEATAPRWLLTQATMERSRRHGQLERRLQLVLRPAIPLQTGTELRSARVILIDGTGRRLVAGKGGVSSHNYFLWWNDQLSLTFDAADLVEPFRLEGEITLSQPSLFHQLELPLRLGSELKHQDQRWLLEDAQHGEEQSEVRLLTSNGAQRSSGLVAGVAASAASIGMDGSGVKYRLVRKDGSSVGPVGMGMSSNGREQRLQLTFPPSPDALHLQVQVVAEYSQRSLPLALDQITVD